VKLMPDAVRTLARARGLTLREALRRAGVSRNAFYNLARRPTVLPNSIHSLAASLGVPASALLDEAARAPEERAAALLREARAIRARHPRSSFDNIWHTLWLMEVSPAERLRRSLVRGRASAADR
jgi:transcriptional regulator with XRE-family HTH domain